jgi:hypothetical protein
MALFQSKYAGQAYWLGAKKLKFHKNQFQTDDPAVIAFLEKQKGCALVPGTEAPPSHVAPVQAEPPAPVAPVAKEVPPSPPTKNPSGKKGE